MFRKAAARPLFYSLVFILGFLSTENLAGAPSQKKDVLPILNYSSAPRGMTKVGRCLLALTVGAGMIFASQSGYPFYQSSQQNRPLATFTNGIPVSLTSVAEGRPSGEQLLILQNAPRCPISSSPYPLNLMIRTSFHHPVLSLDQDLVLTAYEVLDEGERLKRVSGFSAQVRSANPMSVYTFMPAEETIFTSTDEQGRIRSFLIELDPVELKTPLPSGLRKSERPFFILNVRKVSVLQDP